jgi:alkylation response protein AidB-like acyl-CoA dehydrogenase
MNRDFKANFIDKDFDGQSYVRYAEARHGHSQEVIDMFHQRGYMRLIIPKELGGGGKPKAEYYQLISASMQYGDPALSLIIQASTSIGTTPMLLAWKKDLPRALADAEALQESTEKLDSWPQKCLQLAEMLETPDPALIRKNFTALGDEVPS